MNLVTEKKRENFFIESCCMDFCVRSFSFTRIHFAVFLFFRLSNICFLNMSPELLFSALHLSLPALTPPPSFCNNWPPRPSCSHSLSLPLFLSPYLFMILIFHYFLTKQTGKNKESESECEISFCGRFLESKSRVTFTI